MAKTTLLKKIAEISFLEHDWHYLEKHFSLRLLKRNSASMSNLPEELVYLHRSIGQNMENSSVITPEGVFTATSY